MNLQKQLKLAKTQNRSYLLGVFYAEEGNRTPTRSDPRQILRELRISKFIFIQGFYYIQTTCVTRVL